MIRLIFQIIIIFLCSYGVVVLAIEMYNERLELHGFNAFAALFGAIPFMFLCALFPVLIFGLFFCAFKWIFKIDLDR
jgi:hypothetical protein